MPYTTQGYMTHEDLIETLKDMDLACHTCGSQNLDGAGNCLACPDNEQMCESCGSDVDDNGCTQGCDQR